VRDAYGSYENNPEYLRAVVDSQGRLLEGTHRDGSKRFTGDVTVDGSLTVSDVDGLSGQLVDSLTTRLESPMRATLDRLSLAMLSTIGVVGDSYASGNLAQTNGWGSDHYDLSWPQIMARQNGLTAVNFSKAGLRTDTWLTDNHGLTLMQSTDPCDLYVLALGINDAYSNGIGYLGTKDDIITHADSFYGNFATIIESIQKHAPDAFIIMMDMASMDPVCRPFNTAMVAIADHYDIRYIHQLDDPFFSSSLYTGMMIGGHPRAIGYSGMACAIRRLIIRCIVDNPTYFIQFGMK
jgi:hypothetical protein